MINTVLDLINNELNSYLKRIFVLEEDQAILNSILDNSGEIPSENKNKLVLSLGNIKPESIPEFYRTESDSSISPASRPLSINLTVFLSALHDNYNEALTFLSKGILYFHNNAAFTKENLPDLPSNIAMISVEITATELSKMHEMWASLGTNYRPSALLNIRVLTTNNENVIEEVSSIITNLGDE